MGHQTFEAVRPKYKNRTQEKIETMINIPREIRENIGYMKQK